MRCALTPFAKIANLPKYPAHPLAALISRRFLPSNFGKSALPKSAKIDSSRAKQRKLALLSPVRGSQFVAIGGRTHV